MNGFVAELMAMVLIKCDESLGIFFFVCEMEVEGIFDDFVVFGLVV